MSRVLKPTATREPNPVTAERPSPASVDAIGHLVVVPRTTGPLSDVDARSGTQDEIDAAIDDVFGETTNERPGRLDALLLIGGAIVSASALLTNAQGPLLFFGIVAILLGLALPARSLARSTRRRRQVRKRLKAIGDGLPLDASDPTTMALVDAYNACLKAAGEAGLPHGREAADAAHLALVEVASLLAGRQPLGAEETAYVKKRTSAIRGVTLQLKNAHRAWVESRMDAYGHATASERQWATAVTQAREELETTSRLGSLDQLAGVSSSLESEADDAAK
jgi:hypothetical protein